MPLLSSVAVLRVVDSMAILLSQANQTVYRFGEGGMSFTPAGFSLPTPTAEYQLNRCTYDPQTGLLYVWEWKGVAGADTFTTNLWVGVPEPATLGLLVVGGIGALIRRRRR